VEKIFADALAWSASIAVHRAAVPCETPGAWQLPLLFGALPSWERALEKEWSNPSFDHLQLRKTKEKEKKSFSRLPRFNPKLSAYGLRPIAHNFLLRGGRKKILPGGANLQHNLHVVKTTFRFFKKVRGPSKRFDI